MRPLFPNASYYDPRSVSTGTSFLAFVTQSQRNRVIWRLHINMFGYVVPKQARLLVVFMALNKWRNAKEYLQEDGLPLHMAKCSVESDESDIEAEIQDWMAGGGEFGDEDNVRKQSPKKSPSVILFCVFDI